MISRAYYAAFLAARKKAGIKTIPRGENSHELVATYYGIQRDRVQASIGNRLQALRIQRNDADYELGITCAPRFANTALATSEQVLLDLGYLRPSGGT